MESDQANLLLLSVSLLYLIAFVSAQIYPKVRSEVRRKIKIRRGARAERTAEKKRAKEAAEEVRRATRRAEEEEEEKRIVQEERRRRDLEEAERAAAQAVASEEAAARAAAERARSARDAEKKKRALERATEAQRVRSHRVAIAQNFTGIWGDGRPTMYSIDASSQSQQVVVWQRRAKNPNAFLISSVSMKDHILRWKQVYIPTGHRVSVACWSTSRGLQCEVTDRYGSKNPILLGRDLSFGTLTDGRSYGGGEMRIGR